ncbi:MAG: hypothetical protein A2622_05850 [Bdellovibrionales bacterium RIFCSPHIGHO2_01_FULL_40_29]|nr:MAG: hypothetical protein A2622_05850 [Bdellovibrionales bacterium RIFCSPHIGHO2_01_FULL_40_29]OFZ34976.1 MAG: hypothetical protein A3D17_06200 [Bdellovibrionales bacterium RIFCSPHIGHO2_02_FULL_40_15]
MKKQTPTWQEESKKRALKGEIALRETLSEFFDEGLNLLGKVVTKGKKATEAFVAKTQKKSSRLVRMTQSSEHSNSDVKKSQKIMKYDSDKKQSSGLRKNKNSSASVMRSH